MSRAFMIKQASFKPTDIGGCQLWLDASDSTTISLTGSTVTQINDKSGNSNNTSSSTGTVSYAAGGLNSRPAFSFNATGGFRGPTSITGTTLTAFTVATLNSGVNYNGRLLGLANATQNDYAYATTGQPFFCRNGGPNVSGYRNNTYMSYQINTFDTPFIGTSQFTGSSNSTSINGTPGTAVADANGSFSITKYGFGCEGLSDAGVNWYGYCSEMILYNSLLSTPQRQQVEAYLAQKWGLRQQLSPGHPGITAIVYSSQPIPTAIYWRYPSTFVPTQIQPGTCQLWLDAYDSSSVTVSGTTIISVTDKSGKGVVLSNATGYTYPNNTFNGSYPSFLPSDVTTVSGAYTLGVNTSFAVSTPFTIAFVAKRLLTSNTAAAFLIDSGGSSGANREYIWDPAGAFIWQVVTATQSTVASINSSVIVTELGTSPTFFANGSDALSASSITNFTTGGITVGNRYTLNNGFPGHICELIIYSTSLTNTQRQQIEGYLAWKWGLQGSLPANHPYKNSSPSTTNPAGISRPANVLPIPSIVCAPSLKSIIATGGDTIVVANGYKTHTFTTTGTQNFTIVSTLPNITFQVLVIGGGGGGGSIYVAGGGGAGGAVLSTLSLSAASYPVVVGPGGPGASSSLAANGTNGTNSSFNTSLIGYGGGGGAGYNNNYPLGSGSAGGCGGGGAYPSGSGSLYPGGTGSQGGNGALGSQSVISGGGGGGMGGNGVTGSGSGNPPIGGAGQTYTIGGTAYLLASGGGGGNNAAGWTIPATPGGGGYGGSATQQTGGTGTPNTGGGGGGACGGPMNSGGAGGSGIVIIAYQYP